MKKFLTIILSLFLSTLAFADHHKSPSKSQGGVYDYTLKLTNGDDFKLSSLKGKPFMIVNIATRCGYTGQLDDLEKLYKKFKAQGFTIVGIPSNDFGGQTPEGNKQVAEFCRLKYGATFPITNKTVVLGDKKADIVKTLIHGGDEIAWNFEKFLIGKDGKIVERFKSGVEPLSKNLVQAIEGTLK